MLTIDASFSAMYTRSVASVPSYSAKSVKELPSDAAPMGRLADGEVYVLPYRFLTSSDITLLQKMTGESFDSATISKEQSAGTFKGNAFAAAIGWDRAMGALQGDMSLHYLENMHSIAGSQQAGGYYHGFGISADTITRAMSYLANPDRPKVDVSV